MEEHKKLEIKPVEEVPGCAITSKSPQKTSTTACGCYKSEASCSPCGC